MVKRTIKSHFCVQAPPAQGCILTEQGFDFDRILGCADHVAQVHGSCLAVYFEDIPAREGVMVCKNQVFD
jgi:hypothetical protein